MAEPRSPFLDDVRRLLDPTPSASNPDPLDPQLVRGRSLAEVVHRVAEAPSETELARSMGLPYTEGTVGLSEASLQKFG